MTNTQEIKCPHCGTAFTVDEASFADILNQVRTAEFEAELHERMAEAEKRKEVELKLAEAEAAKKFEADKAKQAAEIEKLKADLKAAGTQAELEKTKALADAKAEAEKLKADLKLADAEKELSLQKQKAEFDVLLKNEKDEVARLKDYRAKQNVKMIGESLEQHCEIEFNRIRSAAFPHAVFHKDNDAKENTKGDYIFRDKTVDGIEKVSIMFDMKNEEDATKTKSKNESFLEKLDKDRTAKGCEYAVLVSVLEPDNELYNGGIVDMSHKYPKMYVIRPQFFLTLIMLLSNESEKALAFKQELALMKAQNVDLSNFEVEIQEFKDRFGRNVNLAKKKFDDAIKKIDDTIKAMQATKDLLLGSQKQLDWANDKAQDELTIKKLTKNSPQTAAKFKELGE